MGLPQTRRRLEELCRDSWAFAICTSIELALVLAYEKLGSHFLNRYMSAEYLLSCYEEGPMQVCGCRGADLPTAFKIASELGVVTFNQFPYISSDALNLPLHGGIDVVYFCENTTHLDTCPPCKATLEDYSETVLAASPDIGAYRFTVPCLPCSQPISPKYFPLRPFIVDADGKAARSAAIKAELLRVGPLSFALAVDVEALTALFSGGSPPMVSNVAEGLFYRPNHLLDEASFYTALLVGYSETAAQPPFWICHLQLSGGGFGYDLDAGDGVVTGLFNVDMNDEVAGTLNRVVSFEDVLILTATDAAPRPLSRGDPFLTAKVGETESSQPLLPQQATSYKGITQPKLRRNATFWTLLIFFSFSVLVLLWIAFRVVTDAN